MTILQAISASGGLQTIAIIALIIVTAIQSYRISKLEKMFR